MEQAAETLAGDDRAGLLRDVSWLDDLTADALAIAFGMVVGGVF